MTNKDKALIIVNKLFEICEKDLEVTFSGHIGSMVISWKCPEGNHYHVDDFIKFPEQLKQINQCLDVIKNQKNIDNA